jgi:histidine triad (HIT) family protein
LLLYASSLLRNPFCYWIFISMLEHLPYVIPLKYLRETDNLLAFFHPNPTHPFHVLLIPKQAVRSLADIEPDSPFLADVVSAVQSLVNEYHLPAYRLVVNGGGYQEFPHLHFHLVSDAARPDNKK